MIFRYVLNRLSGHWVCSIHETRGDVDNLETDYEAGEERAAF